MVQLLLAMHLASGSFCSYLFVIYRKERLFLFSPLFFLFPFINRTTLLYKTNYFPIQDSELALCFVPPFCRIDNWQMILLPKGTYSVHQFKLPISQLFYLMYINAVLYICTEFLSSIVLYPFFIYYTLFCPQFCLCFQEFLLCNQCTNLMLNCPQPVNMHFLNCAS